MKLIWYVAAGGALGSVARFLFSGVIQRGAPVGFPAGTLIVNITGSLLLGLLMSYLLGGGVGSPSVRALLTTGFCGGYTTFSTFSYETITLLEDGDWRRALLYASLSLVCSLVAVWLGIAAGRQLLMWRQGV
ncbi:MAG TPA: fluoride efflux transporter CrcB [Gemmatimonadales bacterium]|jgi:CrcB protein|nr:fluoride efflux transporter CrcB [Gemmatimonadales bacterium]